jgi:hypothetical protein
MGVARGVTRGRKCLGGGVFSPAGDWRKWPYVWAFERTPLPGLEEISFVGDGLEMAGLGRVRLDLFAEPVDYVF